ncbi:MAG TPA: hypothetical protein VFR23_24840 [Jiangellaceae bacterium]|nr:hypothetical protein [Jiangellaceae bacterium]
MSGQAEFKHPTNYAEITVKLPPPLDPLVRAAVETLAPILYTQLRRSGGIEPIDDGWIDIGHVARHEFRMWVLARLRYHAEQAASVGALEADERRRRETE